MRRLLTSLRTPFGLAVLGCLALAGWAVLTGGAFDGPIARQVRAHSVYADAGTGLDAAAAERVIGNRRLVVVLLREGADLRAACGAVRGAADGTLVLVMSRETEGFDTYGCSRLAGHDDEHFGDAFVAETTIGDGIDPFADRPLDAVKVIAVNYDRLAKAGIVPAGARTISPSLPRYLIAAAAILAVLIGSAGLYLGARRAGRLAAGRRERRDAATDARTVLSAAMAAVAQRIIDADGRAKHHRRVAADYVKLMEEIAAADRRGEDDYSRFTERAERLAGRLRTPA
ncbi:hypothetical protein GCM10020218_007830 [Dactylosporangium vinaceum]|uniref:TPM domain-containing protein n=1 Tax=Dactylosporangium vinaceum TaxID=53362 RepID=A0ABV5MSG3_9ACTN|nr:hypothetical protein [Dactylosporangium vinaceum]